MRSRESCKEGGETVNVNASRDCQGSNSSLKVVATEEKGLSAAILSKRDVLHYKSNMVIV